ncbi:MAG: hypothetical protein P0Y53_20635 [Candidatus Pseudobacter hemicellulosilyticus]|uniref:Uncharacterized protein n=1 Tax=Candidatus Pseudobacter hemicellulosilyticus TaxID=3121375 RepID=A0AAJ5WQK1_9BACT|nr:MAG: hypothetical protein P0Y53_20635 [Pseudobacter sp.]
MKSNEPPWPFIHHENDVDHESYLNPNPAPACIQVFLSAYFLFLLLSEMVINPSVVEADQLFIGARKSGFPDHLKTLSG